MKTFLVVLASSRTHTHRNLLGLEVKTIATIIPTGKPSFSQVLAAFEAFRAYMVRRNCEHNRQSAAPQCFTSAQDASLALEMEIIRANFANRGLDPEFIRTRREQIAERERVCGNVSKLVELVT